MDQTGSQDQLRLVSIIPDRMVYNARENIALIFNNALPSSKGTYRVEFHGRGREKMQVKAQKVNPSTLIVEAPVYNPAEQVRVCVRFVSFEGMKSLGSLPFHFISRENLMANLLQDCADPVIFMCEALGISPCDMGALDKAMTASFKANMPPGFQLLGLRNDDIGHENSNSLYPTLLHFAAAFGLYHFVKDCLCHCSGFFEAIVLRNGKDKRPSEIAYEGQFMNIYELLCSAENNGEEIYEKMDEKQEEDAYYTTVACHRYINLQLWQHKEEPADDDTDPDGYIKTTRTEYEQDDIYTDMESGCDIGYTTADRTESEQEELYADMESGVDQSDTDPHGYIHTGQLEHESEELYADMEGGDENGGMYVEPVDGYQEEMYMNEQDLYRNEGQSSSHYQVPSNLPVSHMYPEARSISVSLKNRDEYIPQTKPKRPPGPPTVPARAKSQEKKALRPPATPARPQSIASSASGYSAASNDSGIEAGDSYHHEEDENPFMSREELLKDITLKENQKSSEDISPPPPPRPDYGLQSPPPTSDKPRAPNRNHGRSKTQPVSQSDVSSAKSLVPSRVTRPSSFKDNRPQVTKRPTSDLSPVSQLQRPPAPVPAPDPGRRGSDASTRPPAPSPGAPSRGIPTPFAQLFPAVQNEEPLAPAPPPRGSSAPRPAPRSSAPRSPRT